MAMRYKVARYDASHVHRNMKPFTVRLRPLNFFFNLKFRLSMAHKHKNYSGLKIVAMFSENIHTRRWIVFSFDVITLSFQTIIHIKDRHYLTHDFFFFHSQNMLPAHWELHNDHINLGPVISRAGKVVLKMSQYNTTSWCWCQVD